MRGVVFLGDRQLELMEFPDPIPGEGETRANRLQGLGPLTGLVAGIEVLGWVSQVHDVDGDIDLVIGTDGPTGDSPSRSPWPVAL